MLKMNSCLLIASSLVFVVLAVEAYCSCKCDTPEIPYTRIPYVPSLPHIPYKYVSAEISQASVNSYLHQAPSPTLSNHRASYAPIVIVPQVSGQQIPTHLPLDDASAHNSLEFQRKELILQDIGQTSAVQHVPHHQLVISNGHGEASTVSHDNAAATQTLVHLGHNQAYQHVQSGSHDQHDGGGYDGGHEGHHKKNHNIHYHYTYAVNDHKTGDIKKHQEERHGDDVVGEYSLVEDDGNVRTVKYRADWKTGFHAQVHNSKPGHHG